MPFMMTFREFEEFLVDYFEDALPRRQRLVFDWHLRICPDCRDYLEAFKRTMTLMQTAFDEADAEVLSTVPEALSIAILEARNADDT